LEIVGVDFSGARSDDRTWIARGRLDGLSLVLRSCAPARRSELEEVLLSLPGEAVAALDFPFSVPQEFARFWRPEAIALPDLWAAASMIELDGFMALRDDFAARFGEPRRRCDTFFPEAYSCLHKANPNMVPMTFKGMQMLSRLRPAGCDVPPLAPQGRGKALLLEAMPGAALRAFKLPFKGYKNGVNAGIQRRQILDGLPGRSGLLLPNLAEFREGCLESHDCLDAVVAAVTAALWARDPGLFLCPTLGEVDGPDRVSLLEGWLYAPVFVASNAA
jgi:predicted nuclease with RNAse H fold